MFGESEATAFYRASLTALRALDAPLPDELRRFGAEAAARWRLFEGHLGPTERLDLLLADAAVAHPLAFSARLVFALPGLPSDEPFGPNWPSPSPIKAAAWLAEDGPPGSPGAALRLAARAWGAEPPQAAPAALTDLTPATRVAIAGLGALIDLAGALAERPGFDLGDQLVLVTTHPAHRHLAGLAAALAGSPTTPAVFTPAEATAALEAGTAPRVDRCHHSPDAPPDCRAAAARLAG